MGSIVESTRDARPGVIIQVYNHPQPRDEGPSSPYSDRAFQGSRYVTLVTCATCDNGQVATGSDSLEWFTRSPGDVIELDDDRLARLLVSALAEMDDDATQAT